MPKPVINNKIIYQSIYGLVATHTNYLNQGVTIQDSPTFANLQLTGDATIQGNLYVEGNTTILNTNILEFEDNIVLLNRLETGAGVTLNQSGFEIDRGTLENYRIIFNESDKTFRVGPISDLKAVATREDNPLTSGIMMWNNTSKRLDSRNVFSIDMSSSSTTNATSSTSGSFVFLGGIGVKNDIWSSGQLYLAGNTGSNSIFTNSTTNSLNISSGNDIIFFAENNVVMPYDKNLVFGETESIYADSITKNINISGSGHIKFELDNGKRIDIPNQIPLTFSTPNDKIFTDSSNNMNISSSEDIILNPGTSKRVLIPDSLGLSFSNYSQKISANLNNDLIIQSGNDINITPSLLANINIPTDNPIKFGGSGVQKIVSDSNNDLYISASNDIYLSPEKNINIPDSKLLNLGDTEYIVSSNGNLLLSAFDKLNILNGNIIINSENDIDNNISSGSIYTQGGIGVERGIYSKKNIKIESNESESFMVKNTTRNVLKVDSDNYGKVTIFAGDGSVDNASLEITAVSNSNSESLLVLNSANDATPGYMIGRGSNSLDRTLSINIPSYNDYSNLGNIPSLSVTNTQDELFRIDSDGIVNIFNTSNTMNLSSASLIVQGGISIVKDIISTGEFQTSLDSDYALTINDSFEEIVFNIDTNNNITTLNGTMTINNPDGILLELNDSFIANQNTNTVDTSMKINMTNTDDMIDASTASLVVSGGASIQKSLRVSSNVDFYYNLHMHDQPITNVRDPVDLQDVATKAYVDLANLRGLYIKQSVQIATLENMDLNTDFNPGNIIDNYTLKEYDRILIKNQTNPVENGIYIVYSSGPPQRSLDLLSGDHAAGVFTFIQYGELQRSTGWICNSPQDYDMVGANAIIFAQFSGLGAITAGPGLSKNFNDIYVNVDDYSIEIVEDALRIKADGLGTGLTGGSGSIIETTSDQSHVTKLGTIETGEWHASTVDVIYGGTGKTFFSEGNILFGNDSGELLDSSKLYFDNTNTRLGLGTNIPSKNLEISSINDSTILLSADSENNNNTSKPELVFEYGLDTKSYIGMSRSFNDYANNTYPDALIVSHDKIDTTSIIQFATQKQSRMTILPNGNIGISTSSPSANLHIDGTLKTTSTVTFTNTVNSTNVSNGSIQINGGVGIQKSVNIGGTLTIHDTTTSTSSNSGSVVAKGGISILCNQNAVNVGNGGALTVGGGASFGGDVYIGGSINGSGSSSSTYAYLTLTATDEAVNFSTGSLVTFGGITLQCFTNSSSLTDGGSILTEGGASIGKDIYIGGDNYLYGLTNYYSDSSLLNFHNTDTNKCFSIDINDGNFSLSRYLSDTFTEQTFVVNQTTGSILFNNNSVSQNSSTASFIISGGLSISKVTNATSITSGGGLTLAGGASIGKDVFIGGVLTCLSEIDIVGNAYVDGSLLIGNKLDFIEGGLFDLIDNSNIWSYFGIIDETCEINFSTQIGGLKIVVSINSGICNTYHSTYGNKSDFIVYIYKNGTDTFHLFIKNDSNTNISIFVQNKSGTRFNITSEGSFPLPDGNISGYNNTWIEVYNTDKSENLDYAFGNVRIEGSNFKVADNFPIIASNNENTVASRNLGVSFQRYQSSNNNGRGELVNDNYVFFDSLPDQSTSSSTQIKFSNLTNDTDDYYIGWWIKIASGPNIGQVREIVSFNGAQRVAVIDTPWTNQNPSNGDIVYFYNAQFVSFYYNYVKNNFELVYNTLNSETKDITSYDYVGMNLKSISLYDTTPSLNASTGSINTLGGISISNTTDSSNCVEGGTFTTLGGAGISKKLFVGENIAIGTSSYIPDGSLHIKQLDSTIILENGLGGNSSIDFATTSINNRFGILSTENQLSFTYSTGNQKPNNSNKALTITSDGYIGINTTSNINSPVTILSNNLISSDSNTGYIGLISSNTNNINTTNSKLIVYGDNASGSEGNVIISSGTGGSINMFSGSVRSLSINKSGIVNLYSAKESSNATSGSFIVSGGISISCTANSSSISSGGALTVDGGTSIKSDTYIGGNLYVTGKVNSEGSVVTPSITFSNPLNCTVTGYENNKLITISDQGMLSFGFWVTPTLSSENCQIEFSIPQRTTLFNKRIDLIVNCSGYTDDDNVIPLFNVIGAAVKESTRGFIKFQSVSTGIHYLSVTCRYSTL